MKRSIISIAARHFLLEAGDTPGVVRFLGQAIRLADGATQSWVTVTRTGNFSDPRYGDFAITLDQFEQMVRNFNNRVLGQDVFIDVSHSPSNGSAGQIIKLTIDGTRLRALVEWTPFGVDAIKQRGFAYLSADYHEQWKDNEKQQPYGCVLLGAGLTIRPVIKHLDRVQLSDDDDHADAVRTAISPSLLRELTEHSMNKFVKLLAAAIALLGFTDATGKPFTDLLALQLAGLDPEKDETKCLAVVDAVKATADAAMVQIKAAGGDPKHVTIQLAAPNVQAFDMSATFDASVAKALDARDAAALVAQTGLAAKYKLLSETIATGDKTLTPEGVKKFADDYAPLFTAASTDAQVLHLASLAVTQAQALGAARKLAGLGYNAPDGNVHITVDSSNGIKALQMEIDKRLGFEGMPEYQRFERTGGKLLAVNKAFAEKALALFDSQHGHQLDAEHKALAAGVGLISDVAVPSVAERTVLREALYNMTSLNFMNLGTAPFANVITIPYSYRDTSAAGMSALRQYERQAIRKAGVIQTTEEARPIPQKLAFEISAELKLLMSSSSSVIDYDPVSENIRNMIRIVGEDTEAINFNELVCSADESGVTTITDALTPDVDGANTVFVTTKFPVVRPRKIYDLKGAQVGNTTNAIVVTLNAVARAEFLAKADGTALAAGTYYVMDYNLGELHFVTEAGVPVVPVNAWVLTVAYSYTTNKVLWDSDAVVGEVVADQYDRLLTVIGGRKAVIASDRYYNPNMVLMSSTVDNAMTQARSFTANGSRTATGLSQDGSVGQVKGMPIFNSQTPGIMLGDTRIMIGERGNTRFRMVKPWSMNPMEQARNSAGAFIDAMDGFGTQYVLSHTPLQLKNSLTSVIVYSATGRVAR